MESSALEPRARCARASISCLSSDAFPHSDCRSLCTRGLKQAVRNRAHFLIELLLRHPPHLVLLSLSIAILPACPRLPSSFVRLGAKPLERYAFAPACAHLCTRVPTSAPIAT
eukprot:4492878-Pleurochrysis_carterae.AAC.1